MNSSFFSVLLVLVAAKRLWASGGSLQGAIHDQGQTTLYSPVSEGEHEAFVKPDDELEAHGTDRSQRNLLFLEDSINRTGSLEEIVETRLNIRETAWLSFEFCILWV